MVITACVFFVGLLLFILHNFSFDNETVSIHETLRTAVVANKDESARIAPGAFYLNKPEFERSFEEVITESPAYKSRNVEFEFDYLEDDRNKSIKGIRVFVLSEGAIEDATVILSTPEGG